MVTVSLKVLVKGFKRKQLLLVCPKFLFGSLEVLNVPSNPSKDHRSDRVGVGYPV